MGSEFSLHVNYRHFPLHPDTPEEGLTLEELFAYRNFDLPAAQQRMSQLMADEGLPYGPRSMTYNSRLAQELGKWAETQPGGERIHEALFRAYFVDNVNLARIPNLVQIASQIGLPAAEAEQVLATRQFRGAVDADWQDSRQLGITGVPTFACGGRMLVGAQPYDQLTALVSAAGAVSKSAEE